MRPLRHAALLAACVLAATTTYAQDTPPAPMVPGGMQPDRARPGGWMGRDETVNRHRGLLLRPELGFGYLEMSAPTPVGDSKISGAAAFLGFAVGGAIAEDLILAVHLYDGVISDPKVTLGNQSQSTSNTTAGMLGLGPELTYYFMPSNVYISGTLALTRLRIEANGTDGNTNWGIGAQVGLGKEWWVSDHWGLGLVGRLSISSNEDSGPNTPTFTTWGLGLAFSATYN